MADEFHVTGVGRASKRFKSHVAREATQTEEGHELIARFNGDLPDGTKKLEDGAKTWLQLRLDWNARNGCARRACSNSIDPAWTQENGLKYCRWCAEMINQFNPGLCVEENRDG